MLSNAPPVHLLDGQGSLRGLAELDISNSLAFALAVLVDLDALHLSKCAKCVFEILLLNSLATNNEESGVWWDVVILLGVVHCNG